jgi:hypothetical protein
MKERISILLIIVDFKSACNRIDREQMYEAMNEVYIPEKLMRLVKMIISNMQNQIKIQ